MTRMAQTVNSSRAGKSIDISMRGARNRILQSVYVPIGGSLVSVDSPTKNGNWKSFHIVSPSPGRRVTVLCDKLVLATRLTSEPNVPDIAGLDWTASSTPHNVHAKDADRYCRDHLGYHPVPDRLSEKKGEIVEVEPRNEQQPLRSVAVYGANESSFDFVHLFASLIEGYLASI